MAGVMKEDGLRGPSRQKHEDSYLRRSRSPRPRHQAEHSTLGNDRRRHRSPEHEEHRQRAASPRPSRGHRPSGTAKPRDATGSGQGTTDHRPHRASHHRHHNRDGESNEKQTPLRELPFGARQLGRRDLDPFRTVFSYYLAVQKQKDTADMDEREVKGRWKSFMGKWNRGELAEGWYDPDLFSRVEEWRGGDGGDEQGDGPGGDVSRAQDASARVGRDQGHRSPPGKAGRKRASDFFGGVDTRESSDDEDDAALSRDQSREPSNIPARTSGISNHSLPINDPAARDDSSADSDSDVGPSLPPTYRDGARHGAAAPTVSDLDARTELNAQERAERVKEMRLMRKADRRAQKELLEELVPRAAAGTRERALEKKREIADKMRSFRERSPGGGGGAEVDDGTLMGDGDGLEEMKKARAAAEQKKSYRQERWEAIMRARDEEREEIRRRYQEREDETVGMLRELAKRRFGGS